MSSVAGECGRWFVSSFVDSGVEGVFWSAPLAAAGALWRAGGFLFTYRFFQWFIILSVRQSRDHLWGKFITSYLSKFASYNLAPLSPLRANASGVTLSPAATMNPDKLFDYLEGRLSPKERSALEKQLMSDKQLQREFAVARQIHA